MCFVCLFFFLFQSFNFRNLLRWYFKRWICTTALIQVSNHIHVTLLTMCVFNASFFITVLGSDIQNNSIECLCLFLSLYFSLRSWKNQEKGMCARLTSTPQMHITKLSGYVNCLKYSIWSVYLVRLTRESI